MKLELPPRTPLEKLKVAAMYLSLKNALRSSGKFGIGWGLFTVLLGILSRPHALVDYAWFAIGLYLLLQGLWIVRTPTLDPRMVISESIALLILGLWNTVGMYLIIQRGGRPILGGHAFIWGVLQLFSAYPTYKSYPTYQLVCQNLDTVVSDELELSLQGVWKSRTVQNSDTIELKTASGSLGSSEKLKLKQMPDYLILLADKGRMVRVYGKAEIMATSLAKKRLSKSFNLVLRMDDDEFKAESKPEDLELLRKWIPGAFLGVSQQDPPR